MILNKKLNSLIKNIECEEIIGNIDGIEINEIIFNSNKIKKGDMFVALTGEKTDGHKYAESAEENGAAAILAEHKTGSSLPHIIVKDSAKALSLICQNYFDHTSEKLKIIAITGTNGKTSTAWFTMQALMALGKKTGFIGTLGAMINCERIPDKYQPFEPSTPSAFSLNRIFAYMYENGAEYVVMEATSQGLAQERMYNLHVNVASFSNLTPDHLDYHKTIENYYEAKRKLFDMCDVAVVNLDDEYGAKIYNEIDCEKISYSVDNIKANLIAKNVKLLSDHITFDVVKIGEIKRIKAKTPGMFSVYNALCGVSILTALGFGFDEISEAFENVTSVKGRCEVVETGTDYTVIIDYAHSADSLIKIIETLKNITEGRVICVFGCGGDRDSTKRPVMGKAAAEYADFAVVTSDNPRSEDPEKIIEDILEGVRGVPGAAHKTKAITDRTEAIKYAMGIAKKGDIVLLAGKGQETYQIFKNETIHYDEREVVQNILKEKSNIK